MTTLGMRVWIVALAGFCPLGCAAGSDARLRAADAQSAACDALAQAPQAQPGQKQALEACRRQLQLYRQLAELEETEIERTLTPLPDAPRRRWQPDFAYADLDLLPRGNPR